MALIMKTLIVYASVHHQNTEKVAKVMAEELGADLVPVSQAQPATLMAYDLIGFGSGIYGGKSHNTPLQFVDGLPAVTGKQAFIFSTRGGGEGQGHAALKEMLVNRGFSITGEFSCKGWLTAGPLKLFGGINKGRPNEDDLEEARVFVRGLKEEYS
jgi:flavodoxin